MNTVSHIAGPAMTVCGRVIQRCSVCGEKLVDSKNTAAPVEPCQRCNKGGMLPSGGPCPDCNGEGWRAPPMATWEPGRQIQVSVGANPRRSVLLPDGDRLAADSCIILVE